MEKVYARILYRIENGENIFTKSRAKKEQYIEIEKRYRIIKHNNPEYNIAQIARIISKQKAPRFYISENRAILLYYKLLRNKDFRICNTLSLSYS